MAKARLPERMVATLLESHKVDFTKMTSGKHIKFTLTHKDRRKVVIVPGSISDHRGIMNLYSDVRRIIKGFGITFVEDKSLTRN